MNKYISFIIISTACIVSSFVKVSNSIHNIQATNTFGYIERGDSIEFRFGEEKQIQIGLMNIDVDKRRADIKKVNVAGDFNGWNPNHASFVLKKINDKLYSLVVSKKNIGQKGEIHLFKFVLNGVYWIEPPKEAMNKMTGKDHNTNLYLKL